MRSSLANIARSGLAAQGTPVETMFRTDSPQGQYAKYGDDASTISGDPKIFGTVYLGKRGILVGSSSN